MWFSKDGIPEKHQVRFIKFKLMNPNAVLTLIYSDKYLTPAGRDNLRSFAQLLNIRLVKYETISPVTDEERIIKKSIDQELEYFFTKTQTMEKGNLSVVADRLKLFEKVLEIGIQSDCDVEFNAPLPDRSVIATLGIIAKTRKGVQGYEGGLRISNDLLGGHPKHPVFITAKKLLCDHIQKYHDALPAYFQAQGISYDPNNHHNHPQYFQARNERLSEFSLGCGPQIFAIAFHQNGISTGYENISTPEVFKLEENLQLTPYIFLNKHITKKKIRHDFSLLLPNELGKSIAALWDHSWQEGNESWKNLFLNEQRILNKFKSQFSAYFSLLKSPSQLKSFFSYFMQSNLHGKRNSEFHELTPNVQEYIKENETPNEAVRSALVQTLGEDFEKIASTLSSDGLVILPGYFQGKQLADLQAVFSEEITKKKPHPFLKQAAFNAAVDTDEVNSKTFDTVLEAATNAHLQALIKYHFGQNQTVVGMRGYRQFQTAPILYRAWDFHQDLKTSGPYGEIKIMLLLNEVTLEGQAMRIMKGSHNYHWHSKTQQQTKYSMEESLGYAKDNCATICFGPPATVILFDTNALHSGYRNEHSIRDIFTISYTPNSKDAPIMHEKFAKRRDETAKQVYEATPNSWKNLPVTNGTLSKEDTHKELEKYNSTPTIDRLKRRYDHNSSMSFAHFLIEAISVDVNGDLDLPLRLGKEDTARDNQLIAFRDVSPTYEQYKRVAARISKQIMTVNYDLNISAMRNYAKLAGEYKNNKQKEISHCALFTLDLLDAFNRIDSRQRLRTTISYLYFTLDRMQLITNDIKLSEAANHVFKMYFSLVYLDDLEYRLDSNNACIISPNCISQLFKPRKQNISNTIDENNNPIGRLRSCK